MEKQLHEILYNYPIPVDCIMTLKSKRIWKITGKDKTYILKALSFPLEETSFIVDAMNHLKKQEFSAYSTLVPTTKGASVVFCNHKYYMLMNFISGLPPSFENSLHLELLGGYLAGFHQKARGYHPSSPYPGRIKWGIWPEMIKEKSQDLETFKETIKPKEKFDTLFCRFLPYYLEEAAEAATYFASLDYEKQWQKEKDLGGFCHHDLAHHNFILQENAPYLIDFDYAIADISCHDVANLVGKILKATHWDVPAAMTVLESYNKEKTFTKEEPKLIKGMLRFPQDFWQCVFARYSEGNISHHTEKKLSHWLKERTLRKKALADLENLF